MTSTDKHQVKVVLFVQSVPPLPAGGAEIHTLRLAKKLMEQGVSLFVIAPGKGKVKGWVDWQGVPVFCVHSFLSRMVDGLTGSKKEQAPIDVRIDYDDDHEITDAVISPVSFKSRIRYNLFILNAFLFLRKRKKDFNLIHVLTIEWLGYAAVLLSTYFKKKVLLTDSTINGISNMLRYPAGKRKQSLIIREAAFVALSRAMYDHLVSAGIAKDKVSIIHNGIETDPVFKRFEKTGQQVIFVGNLYQQPAKGVDILLKAWPAVLRSIPHARLMIVGDGNISSYNSHAKHLGIDASVMFLGRRHDVGDLLLQSDVFVLPSRREGMSNALMEAMMKALPCVATDITGAQDLITDKVSGLLVPPKNSDALAGALLFMLLNPEEAKRMGEAGRVSVIEKCNMDSVAAAYVKKYEEVLNN